MTEDAEIHILTFGVDAISVRTNPNRNSFYFKIMLRSVRRDESSVNSLEMEPEEADASNFSKKMFNKKRRLSKKFLTCR